MSWIHFEGISRGEKRTNCCSTSRCWIGLAMMILVLIFLLKILLCVQDTVSDLGSRLGISCVSFFPLSYCFVSLFDSSFLARDFL